MIEASKISIRSPEFDVIEVQSLDPAVVGEHKAKALYAAYQKPVLVDETIEVRTWLTNFRKVRCQRKYEFFRMPDEVLVAQGETSWVFVNIADGRPRSVPDEIRDAFSLPDQ